jgi:hypothetical protein
LNITSDPLAETAMGLQGDQRGIRVLFVAIFYWRLDGSKLFGLHGTLLSRCAPTLVINAFIIKRAGLASAVRDAIYQRRG